MNELELRRNLDALHSSLVRQQAAMERINRRLSVVTSRETEIESRLTVIEQALVDAYQKENQA